MNNQHWNKRTSNFEQSEHSAHSQLVKSIWSNKSLLFDDHDFIELFQDSVFERLVVESVADCNLEGDRLVDSQTFGDDVRKDESAIELDRVFERNVDRNHETFGGVSRMSKMCSKLYFKMIENVFFIYLDRNLVTLSKLKLKKFLFFIVWNIWSLYDHFGHPILQNILLSIVFFSNILHSIIFFPNLCIESLLPSVHSSSWSHNNIFRLPKKIRRSPRKCATLVCDRLSWHFQDLSIISWVFLKYTIP